MSGSFTTAPIRFLMYPLIGFGVIHLFGLYTDFGSRNYFLSGVISSFYSAVLWEGNQWIVSRLKNKFPAYQQTYQRILIQVVLSVLFTLSIVAGLTLLLNLWLGRSLEWKPFFLSFRPSLLITFAVTAVAEASYFFNRWKSSILEAEKLKREHIQSQFETLKNQVNPHFLFNCLNTLLTLIPEDPRTAETFTRHLSTLYRSILQTKDKELVPLLEELNIVHAFTFLLKTRFSENICVETNLTGLDMNRLVAPLALQMLIENAVKHNIISAGKPLHIRIYSQDGHWLVVENNLQPRLTPALDSTYTGLTNIINRYQLLGTQAVEVLVSEACFSVRLPLLSTVPH